MKISLYTALILVILAIISIIAGIITEQYELFASISLVCSYSGLLAGVIGWVFLLRMWHKEEKEWDEKKDETDTSETIEYDSCTLTFK